MAINGNLYDWESVHIVTPAGELGGITEISYSDERGVEARYGKGGKPRGYGRKNYKASGSMQLDRDAATLLQAALGGSFYKAAPFPVIAAYSNGDQAALTDVLPDCKITKAESSAKQEDDNAGTVKIEFEILSPILWNGVSAY